MKLLKGLPIGLVLAASLMGATSASAGDWHPQNAVLTATQVGAATFTAGTVTITCSKVDAQVLAVDDRFQAGGMVPPIAFSSCLDSFALTASTVTTTGTWGFTATSTTAVDITADAGTPGVSVIDFTLGAPPLPVCTITVPGPLRIPLSLWSNVSSRLTFNPAVSFAITKSGFCPGVGNTATVDLTLDLYGMSVT